MDFNTFPAQWGWVAIILAGVAFLMAIPPLLKMKWGGPRITISPETDDVPDYHYLVCDILNIPIHKGLLYHLGVRREMAQDVTAQFEIIENGTGRVVCPMMPVKIKTQSGIQADRVSLPASFVPASFAIAYASRVNKEVGVFRAPPIILPIGSYKVRIEILVEAVLNKGERDFVVDSQFPFIHWVAKSL